MSKTIGFIADSAADIPKDLQEKYDIKVIPLCPTVDGITYTPGVDITNEEYYDVIKNSKGFPTTSQPPAELVADAYREVLDKYDSVIYVTIGSPSSGTFGVANMAAEEFIKNGADITVVDSMQLSIAIGVPVINAAQMYGDGKEKEEIIEYLMTATRRDTPYFLLDDLTQARKSGRLKGSKVIIANLLDIKPILWLDGGLGQVMDKVRGTKKSISKLVEIMLERGDKIKEQTIYIVHARGGEKLDFLIKLIDEKIAPKVISIMEVGPTIVSHTGLGVVGVYFVHA